MKTLTIFAAFMLIFGAMASTLAGTAYTQDDTDVLLRIAIQADEQISHQLDDIYPIIPSDIHDLYEEGHAAIESLRGSLADGNVIQARTDFLTTMKSFKQITSMISRPVAESQLTQSSDVLYSQMSGELSGNLDRDLDSELNRLVKHVDRIKSVSQNHNTGISFSKVDDMIAQTRYEITAGVGNPAETMDQLKRLINSVKKNIYEHASQDAPDRMKRFVDKKLDDIEKQLKDVATTTTTIITTESTANAGSTQIYRAYSLIAQIKTMISENNIDNVKPAVHDLVDLVKKIQRSVR